MDPNRFRCHDALGVLLRCATDDPLAMVNQVLVQIAGEIVFEGSRQIAGMFWMEQRSGFALDDVFLQRFNVRGDYG